MQKRDILHLYWRAGFGLSPNELGLFEGNEKEEIINDLFLKSETITPLKINTSEIDSITQWQIKNNKEDRSVYNKLNSGLVKKYNPLWISRLSNSNEILREKMTLFWANHFVVRDSKIKRVERFNNTLRNFALGDFRTFVKAISREPSMIQYLNLNKNHKNKPNENFARELMELFTLGIGNYNENDIKESARAFSGYNTNFKPEFVFKKKHHDFGEKTFLGESGTFNGDQIIDIILNQKQCARFISSKIYKYFVNEKVNESHINLMTEIFYRDYNIENLMRYVFSSDWFYNHEHIGSKIKSPIELLIGINKIVPIRFNDHEELLKVQSVLDQKLLYPPNVAGWKGGKHWINTNSILVRVKLPSMLLEKESFSLQPKGNLTDNFKFVYKLNKYQNKLDVSVDWKNYKNQVKKMNPEDLLSILILSEINTGTRQYLKSLGKLTRRGNLARMMCLPEYQMC
jgi:uncharacterized protein (DUF1800 family)